MRSQKTLGGLVVAVVLAVLAWWIYGDSSETSEPTTVDETSETTTVDEGLTPSAPSPTELTLNPSAEPTVQTGEIDSETGLTFVTLERLPPEAIDTLRLIADGGPFPYDQDGVTFENREGILPDHPEGYYAEYTVETPSSDDRGARRIVVGSNLDFFYTDDHYDSFSRIAL